MPGEDADKLYATIREVINDPAVEVVPRGLSRPAPPPSKLDTVMFRALEKATQSMFPGAVTLPSMLTGATDMAQLRGTAETAGFSKRDKVFKPFGFHA